MRKLRPHEFARAPLVARIGVGVQESNRQRFSASVDEFARARDQRRLVERKFDNPVGSNTLGYFEAPPS